VDLIRINLFKLIKLCILLLEHQLIGNMLIMEGYLLEIQIQILKLEADFDIPIRARAIRIHPVTWYNWICLRFDAIYID
jgi:hypothetical protein